MYEIYKVMDAETLEDIGKKFDTTADEIYQLNGFDDDFSLKSGMLIVVPKLKNDIYWYYTVKKGDNIYNIAKEYDVDYKILLALNGLDKDDYIYPNQTLVMPKKDISIYLTEDNDTIGDFIKRNSIDKDDFMRENEKIFLRSEQIVAFRKK